MQKEILLYLLKSLPNNNFKKFLNSIDPLPFKNCHTNHYIECILNIQKFGSAKDELICLYEDLKPSRDRLSQILAIGSEINFEFLNDNKD
jgi:hypothetical protein